ncbi:UvrD-helicase domain-containing protein [Sinorhizobium meliloti]|uniref:UvrD-helicase domain-containing protein n=1 Tax=Rhizobium meliloti TaxID=382 RepID=UPI000FD9CA98|nr:UvrD-helicase domain-containing protein [Sinorhizobium meliloti]MDW9682834.1 AAA family ATPase [Sinorhizobium meliloti]MDW9693974.1 AAA family ATPase [Sinorhizobium meliloti]MDW9718926.1 AAA family ATPase [Sinorhizobium meliloti]MDW9756122.1 AAA family ATPase [Sinorhizobium meliloti]MDW9984882.1 AAA family ATPase [Sinorhizobium meliloti]
MTSWNEVRSQARQWHDELARETGGLVPADVLISRAKEKSGVLIKMLAPDSILLDGARATYISAEDPEPAKILCANNLEIEDENFCLAHEFGHHRLHDVAGHCSHGDIDEWTPAEPQGSAVGESDAYSPKQRREAQANLFGREFLLPRDKLKARFVAGGTTAVEIAREMKVPEQLVLQQLADAVLLPADPPVQPPRKEPDPDPSQLKAINAKPGPHQVRAGPGTGKTRTLVSRVAHLIENEVAPSSILALTYSNDSAFDLASRIQAGIGEKSAGVWTGTFHAFGLEVLRLYWSEIGPNDAPKLATRTDQLFLLEELMPELELDLYFDLHEPLRGLKSIVSAISRAKDEICSPAQYANLAEAMEVSDPNASAKAKEVARVYKTYDDALRQRGMVDFGDLIIRPIELFKARPEIAEAVRATYPNVLVDEYQDMNRASGEFLKLLADPGRGPWVVGDVKQSIYRFRGASPINMSRFRERFNAPDPTDLEVNYRSGGRIVSVFDAFGRTLNLGEGTGAKALHPYRGTETGVVEFNVAATREAEQQGIAARIQLEVSKGGTYRDHAVLARSHGTLVKVTAHLERSGIPSLYFGDFFERPEIRDFLSLLSVAADHDGLGLMRVGQWPKYAIPVTDIIEVLHRAGSGEKSLLTMLQTEIDPIGLSDEGMEGLRRLSADLRHVQFKTTPHHLWSAYLFNKGGALAQGLVEDTVIAQQRRLAIYQLLQIAFEHRSAKGDPKRAFLDYVRRLEILDEEKEFRRLPAAAAGIDAVRLMTVHASKGLEFPVVHIPSLSPSHFPPNNRYDPCPPPHGMIESNPLLTTDMEEKSLFFVALSRAKDVLSLSRSNKYGGQSRPNPSALLDPIKNMIPKPAAPTWVSEGKETSPYPGLQCDMDGLEEITVEAVERYNDCPRKFYYQDFLKLRSRTERGPYLRFISVVRSTVKWLQATPPSEWGGMGQQFSASWQEHGPVNHPHGGLYERTAMQMLALAQKELGAPSLPTSLGLVIAGKKVKVSADNIQARGSKIVVQRLKAGRLAKKEKLRIRDALIYSIVARENPGLSVGFEHVSLWTGERSGGGVVNHGIVGDIESCFEGIAKGRFDPVTSDRNCPTCPYYFICAADGIRLPA